MRKQPELATPMGVAREDLALRGSAAADGVSPARRTYRVQVTLEMDADMEIDALCLVRREVRQLAGARCGSAEITHAWMTARAILSIDAACPSCDGQGGRVWHTRGSVAADPQTEEVCERCEGGGVEPVAFCERSGVPVDECVGCREEAHSPEAGE